MGVVPALQPDDASRGVVDDAELERAAPIGLLGEGVVEDHLRLRLVYLPDHPQRAFGDPGDGDRDLGRRRARGHESPGDESAGDSERLPLASTALRDAVQALKAGGRQLLQYIPQRVPWMKQAIWPTAANNTVIIRATAHQGRSGRNPIGPIHSGDIIKKGFELKFEAVTAVGMPYAGRDVEVRWQVVNTDYEAMAEDSLRGGFYPSESRAVHWETTAYHGIHWVQAYVIRRKDRKCIGRSERFFVVIE
jgi:hypothetical protein